MVPKIFAIVASLALVVVGVYIYLSPDDLTKCQEMSMELGCGQADAIVVISGGDTNARTEEAIKLYRDGWAPLIIVSGAAADKSGPSNASAMREHAIASGVPESSVVAEESSETTKQNAVEVKQIIESREIEDIILVTSGYHVRRAKLEFQSQLPNVSVRVHPASNDKQWGSFWWLTPWGWQLAISELVKIALFSIGGTR